MTIFLQYITSVITHAFRVLPNVILVMLCIPPPPHNVINNHPLRLPKSPVRPTRSLITYTGPSKKAALSSTIDTGECFFFFFKKAFVSFHSRSLYLLIIMTSYQILTSTPSNNHSRPILYEG